MTLYQRAFDPDFLVWIFCVAIFATAIYVLCIINDGTSQEQQDLREKPLTVIAKSAAIIFPMAYSASVIVVGIVTFLSGLE